MKFTPSFLALSLLASVLSRPTQDARDEVQTAHMVFHGDSDSYKLDVKADGKKVETNKKIAIRSIDIPDYNADSQCVFKTDDGKTAEGELDINQDNGNQRLVFKDPKPISSVSCEGMCVASLGDCYDHNNQYIGPCCAGYCAATKCRPWNGV